ncbi:MAG: hypothetical protein COY81_01095 [Candidatus Pacebacteria bacterium CG_4_10_14_0_8_um_filter_43_12]|nr:MAG: hypothetical protein COU66_01530 [Candidatus Pacebacteria bacterium CG10_big_fil_rev_8_21_14_0_10_44_11]PIY79742.1 MAG: hypothetical protein COY81_01095 [Candidatus Pacebacteria bacterium CG_4_10_14_0_8_um_filter_43_12]
MKIYPALLSDSRSELQRQLDLIGQQCSSELVSLVQVDVIDGKFADNVTLTPSDLPDLNWGDLQLDIHLMVEEPLDYVYELIDVKNQLPIRGVIAQVERMTNRDLFLEEVEKNGWLPGLSLDLFTPVDELETQVPHYLKIIQIMAIEAGFQGETFKPVALEKIKTLKPLANQLGLELIVDGGVNQASIGQIAAAGANAVAVGSALWQSASISDTIESLTKA